MQLKRKSIRGARRECLVGLGLALASLSAGAELVAGASAAAGQKVGIEYEMYALTGRQDGGAVRFVEVAHGIGIDPGFDGDINITIPD